MMHETHLADCVFKQNWDVRQPNKAHYGILLSLIRNMKLRYEQLAWTIAMKQQ